jgi:NADH-quinone oxidoreductase subunit F
VGANEVVVATKASFTGEVGRLRTAIDEVAAAGWLADVAPDGDVALRLVTGPSEYLFGEETALLEVVSGRDPFPRVAPPFRRGIDAGEGTGAEAEMSGPDSPGTGEPALVNNVETMAHAALILAKGADWFRELGTAESPGTIVVTISGDVDHAGVGEVPMGTLLSEAIADVAGGPRPEHTLVAALSGVANPLLPVDRFDTPLTYEDLPKAGSGLGAAGFLVFDETADLVAVVEGVSHFLSIESCGQCTPCKQDGLAITGILGELRTGTATDATMTSLGERLATVTDGARCFLATQHQTVVDGLLDLFPDEVASDVQRPHASGRVAIAAIADIVEGVVRLDPSQDGKQPDWTHDRVDSGQSPADRIDTGGGRAARRTT